MLVRLVQSKNAPTPIDVTFLGMVILVRPAQSENAYSPIDVILDGMVMAVRPVQFENAKLPIDVTLAGMVKTLLILPGACINVDFSLLYNIPASLA